jgi:hypothetical protein
MAGDSVCFTLAMHDTLNVECCNVRHCIVLPDCPDPCIDSTQIDLTLPCLAIYQSLFAAATALLIPMPVWQKTTLASPPGRPAPARRIWPSAAAMRHLLPPYRPALLPLCSPRRLPRRLPTPSRRPADCFPATACVGASGVSPLR